MLGDVGQDPAIIQRARTMIQEYMKDPSSVDPTLASSVITVAARHGDAELYQQYKAQLQKVKSPQQYRRFFNALADFPQPALTKQTLESTLTLEVRSQDLNILFDLLANPASQNATWDFMRQNSDAIIKKAGGASSGQGIFLYGPQNFCSEQKATEVKQFFEQHPFPGAERNQKQTLEAISGCAEFVGQQQSKLAAWLKQNGNTTASSVTGTAVEAAR